MTSGPISTTRSPTRLSLTTPPETNRPSCELGAARVVLIGTAETLEHLLADVSEAANGAIRGCLLVDEPHAPLVLPVIGVVEDLPELHLTHQFDLAVVCLPESQAIRRAAICATLGALAVPTRVVPTLDDLLAPASAPPAAPVALPAALGRQQVNLTDLIGRRPHPLDPGAVGEMVSGSRVLVTGAGGSIGSELTRLVARFDPSELVLLERSENALFEIDRQLARSFPTVSRRAVLHDVVDERATRRVLERARPDVVFHAAAHKHVPLMEDHPVHAIRNNLLGTKSIADAAVHAGASRFVMISSDKAVNPTSVMGATKRLAELYVRGLAEQVDSTALSLVRFGNVIGSACSVLTIWTAQLADGGPITVTDPRMTRFFMTIPEAATLVTQAATMASTDAAGVFVLDMGQPIKIVDLAGRFLRAHGLIPRAPDAPSSSEPDPRAMDIAWTGVRPGEKLHEELVYEAEQLAPTSHPGISVWRDSQPVSRDETDAMIRVFSAIGFETEHAAVIDQIRRFVPELHRDARIEDAA